MKKLLTGILLAVLAIPLMFTALFTAPAFAGDAAAGGAIFSANCAACHIGGGNVVNAEKTLQLAVLEANGMADIEAIKTQVTNGKNAMPAFGGKLSPEEIDNVAAYVLSQAEGGW